MTFKKNMMTQIPNSSEKKEHFKRNRKWEKSTIKTSYFGFTPNHAINSYIYWDKTNKIFNL